MPRGVPPRGGHRRRSRTRRQQRRAPARSKAPDTADTSTSRSFGSTCACTARERSRRTRRGTTTRSTGRETQPRGLRRLPRLRNTRDTSVPRRPPPRSGRRRRRWRFSRRGREGFAVWVVAEREPARPPPIRAAVPRRRGTPPWRTRRRASRAAPRSVSITSPRVPTAATPPGTARDRPGIPRGRACTPTSGVCTRATPRASFPSGTRRSPGTCTSVWRAPSTRRRCPWCRTPQSRSATPGETRKPPGMRRGQHATDRRTADPNPRERVPSRRASGARFARQAPPRD